MKNLFLAIGFLTLVTGAPLFANGLARTIQTAPAPPQQSGPDPVPYCVPGFPCVTGVEMFQL